MTLNISIFKVKKCNMMRGLLDFHNWNRIAWHVLACGLYINVNYGLNRIRLASFSYWSNVLYSALFIIAFYWFVWVLRQIGSKEYMYRGIAALVFSLFLLYQIAYFFVYRFFPDAGVELYKPGSVFNGNEFLQNYLLSFIRVFSYSLLYYIAIRNIELIKESVLDLQEKLILKDKINHYQSGFLTAQIFPHFVRNTLQVLTGKAMMRDDEESSNILLWLSSIMDYNMEQTKVVNKLVYVSKEIKYLELLTDLVRKHHENDAVVELVQEGSFSGEKIPPLTLLTFVENVFKYGTISIRSPLIIRICFDELGFSFYSRNRKKTNPKRNFSSQMGLQNVKQRLKMHLPDLHELEIREDAHYFEVMLAIRNEYEE